MKIINEKMAKTFSQCRNHVILNKTRKRMSFFLYTFFLQIEEEFRRITLKPLQSTFLGKLDQYTTRLLSLYRRNGGAVGKKLHETLDVLNEACIYCTV